MHQRFFTSKCVRMCLVFSGLVFAYVLHGGVTQSRAADEAAPADAQKLPPAAHWLDPNSVAVLEVLQPKPLLSALLDQQTTAAIAANPLYKQLAAQEQFKQFVQFVRLLELTCGTDWRSGIQKLLGGGVVASVDSSGGLVIIIDSEDQKLLEDVHRVLLELAKSEAAKQGQPQRVASKEYRGVTAWTFGGGEAHAIVGRRLLLANRSESLRTVLDLRAESGAKSLAATAGYQAAKRAAGDCVAMAYLNTAALRNAPELRETLQQSNPWAALLLPGVADAVLRSDWLAFSLRMDGNQLALVALADQAGPTERSGFARPQKPGEGPLPLLQVRGQIASAAMFRDLYRFYAAKDELFPERTSALILFENMMGIFFSGRDLTEEVFKELRPEIRLVVAKQQYDPKLGTPKPQIPAFAAVLRLRNPADFAEVVEEAWQKAFGLVSFTRGQKAEPGLILDRVTHRGTKFTVAYFSTRAEKGKKELDARFNFRPALAMPGDWVILSSTEALARDLIDALAEESSAAAKRPAASSLPNGVHSVVELDGTALAELLRVNRESLVRQEIIEKGKNRQEAENEQDLLAFLVGCANRVRLSLGGSDKHTLATLEMTVKLPTQQAAPPAK